MKLTEEQIKAEINKRIGTYQTVDFAVKCSIDVMNEQLVTVQSENEKLIDGIESVEMWYKNNQDEIRRRPEQMIEKELLPKLTELLSKNKI